MVGGSHDFRNVHGGMLAVQRPGELVGMSDIYIVGMKPYKDEQTNFKPMFCVNDEGLAERLAELFGELGTYKAVPRLYGSQYPFAPLASGAFVASPKGGDEDGR